jgi:hypothetical protein
MGKGHRAKEISGHSGKLADDRIVLTGTHCSVSFGKCALSIGAFA